MERGKMKEVKLKMKMREANIKAADERSEY
jgi:hypothetical protein